MIEQAERKQLIESSYEMIQKHLEQKDSFLLLEYLDSRSRKIAETASYIIRKRDDFWDVVSYALENKILKTQLSKICFLNTAYSFGKTSPNTIKVSLHFLHDRNKDVAFSALWGIVLNNEPEYIPLVKKWRDTSFQAGTQEYLEASRALEALEQRKPSIFSPYFRDSNNVWK